MPIKRLIPASKAIAKAKQNALIKKRRIADEIMSCCIEKIDEMIADGVVLAYVPLTEEQKQWGLELAKEELENAGYKVSTEDEEDESYLVISIEHLK
jgi:hypothetical protein